MPRISEFYGIVINLYWRDHNPPHFHAEYGEHEALMLITSGAVLAGSLPPRALRLVRTWLGYHHGEIQRAWGLALRHEDPGTIEPLP